MADNVTYTRIGDPIDKPGFIPAADPVPQRPEELDSDADAILRYYGVPKKQEEPKRDEQPVEGHESAQEASQDGAEGQDSGEQADAQVESSKDDGGEKEKGESDGGETEGEAAEGEPDPEPKKPKGRAKGEKPVQRRNSIDKLHESADKLAKVAESLGKQAKAEEPRPVPQSSDEEDPDVALRLAAVESLQRHKKYAGRDLVSGYKRFLDDLKSYRSEWEKQNPKAVFDLDDPEHDDWRDKHEPDIEPEDIMRAEFNLLAEAKVNQALQQVRQERALEKAELQAERVIPTIEQEVVQDLGGDTLDALKEKDRYAAAAARESLPQLRQLVPLVYQICTPDTGVQPDPRDPQQQYLLGLMSHYEQAWSQLPDDQLVVNGRKFVTMKDYARLSPQDRAKVWTLGRAPDVMAKVVAEQFKQHIKSRASQLRELIGEVDRQPEPAKPKAPAKAETKPTTPDKSQRTLPPEGGTGGAAPLPGTTTSKRADANRYIDYFA